MALQTQPFVFDCPSRRGPRWPALKMTAKCYRPSADSPVDGLTLIFFHCNGAHKEQWEPIITYLFSQSQSYGGQGHFTIREAWAFDWPNHGDAGVLNRELLEKRTNIVSIYDWVPGIVLFLRSEHIQGHRVVLCGHSASTTAAVLAAVEFYPNLASAGITGLILIESGIMTHKLYQEDFQIKFPHMISVISSRRDKWKSRQDAALYFQNQLPWNKWDPQVLRLYIEHGLYELDDGTVALKCDKKDEGDAYLDIDPHTDSVVHLGKLCRTIPVHTVWGAHRNDFIPDSAKAALGDTSQGRLMASVTAVRGAGHMVVQEQPIGLAQAIGRILETVPPVSTQTSKL